MKTDNDMKTDNEMKQFIKNNIKFVHPAKQKILTDENYLKEKYELMKAVVDGFEKAMEINIETEKNYIKFFLKFLPQNLKKKAKGYETSDVLDIYFLCEEIEKYLVEFTVEIADKMNEEAFEMGLTIIELENGAFNFNFKPDYLENIKARLSKILSSIDTIIENSIENEKRLEFEKNQKNKIKSIEERTNEAVQKFNKATGENIEINEFVLLTPLSND